MKRQGVSLRKEHKSKKGGLTEKAVSITTVRLGVNLRNLSLVVVPVRDRSVHA